MVASVISDKQIRAWALTKPYATKVIITRHRLVRVRGLRRRGGFGWYFLGTCDDIAVSLPLHAADGDANAIRILGGISC